METHTPSLTPMTDEQKFFFDLNGWIVLPGVLTPDEIEVAKAEAYAGAEDNYSGALQNLLDHPAITGILSELLCEPPFIKDDRYGFRVESSMITTRPPGWDTSERTDNGLPHVVRPPQQANAMRYQFAGGRIFSGLTRVVWELEPVRAGQGGTTFLNGSHKANFNYGGPDPYIPNVSGSPWEEKLRESMVGYSCPAGSVVIFTESLVHAANNWTNPDNPRCAVFNCYNSAWAQWHKLKVDHETVMSMPPMRRTLFRGVSELGNDGVYSITNSSL